jgi:uncharacterized protein (TIGR02246 family)
MMKTLQCRSVKSLLLACLLALGCTQALAQDIAEGDVATAILALELSWNSGDMAAYLAQYQQDDTLSLTFGNTVVQGWKALDTLFRESYPDPVRMGRFTIDRVDVRMLSDDIAVAYGNFTHVFPHETVKGGFSHVLTRNAQGAWIIQHERTSRGETIETP